MNPIQQSTQIQGIKTIRLASHTDSRGLFMETFRKEWFPEMTWHDTQGNRSDSQAGVVRGLHYHLRQSDYWILMSGHIRVGLHDLRPASETFGCSDCFDMVETDPIGVLIPPGIAHGYVAVQNSVLTYLVDAYYDNTDEQGILWNDPALGIGWNFEGEPILSPRDEQNPLLRDIPAHHLPA